MHITTHRPVDNVIKLPYNIYHCWRVMFPKRVKDTTWAGRYGVGFSACSRWDEIYGHHEISWRHLGRHMWLAGDLWHFRYKDSYLNHLFYSPKYNNFFIFFHTYFVIFKLTYKVHTNKSTITIFKSEFNWCLPNRYFSCANWRSKLRNSEWKKKKYYMRLSVCETVTYLQFCRLNDLRSSPRFCSRK